LDGKRIRIDYDCVVDARRDQVVQMDRYEGVPLR
jgi:hypothetical protein